MSQPPTNQIEEEGSAYVTQIEQPCAAGADGRDSLKDNNMDTGINPKKRKEKGGAEKLAKRYGNVYSIFIGPRPVVVINGLQALKEALINKADDFSGRPQDQMVNHAVVVKGKTMNPNMLFHSAASSIICQVLFAQQFDYEDEFIKFFVGLFHATSKMINGCWGLIYDSFPMVRNLPLPFQKAFKLFRIAHEKRMEMLAENKKTRVPGKPRHFIDCYLDELERRGEDASSFSEDQLCAFILDLHFAGSDATANTLLSAFLYLMNYPEIQERCQQEIDNILDGKDEPSFEDRHQMPYVQAVIHEIQRMADIAPLSVFHSTTNDTELMGYSIPRGTMIIPNLSSVLSEEGQWKFPHEFNPENFLNDQGEFVKPEAFMPFSIGPRTCLGEGLARMELYLIMVSLLRRFKFIWPEDAGKPDFTPVYGVSQTPKPYHMKVELRKTIPRQRSS